MRTAALLLAVLGACEHSSDLAARYMPCPGGSTNCEAPCLAFGDASVCGPTCDGLGRCGDASLAGNCLWNNQAPDEPGLCVLTCTTTDDCPVDAMTCRACDFGEACVVGDALGAGPGVCAWPDGSWRRDAAAASPDGAD